MKVDILLRKAAWRTIVNFPDEGIWVAELCRKSGLTYSHICRLCVLLEENGLIKRMHHRSKKNKFLKLTQRGMEVKIGLLKLVQKLK